MLLFLRKQEVLALHQVLIEEFGGSHGLRDEGALESALAAAENREHYEHAGLALCAATYAYHLTQAHAFVDGNKRIAAAASEAFVKLNGGLLRASSDHVVELFMAVAAGDMSRQQVEQMFTQWLK